MILIAALLIWTWRATRRGHLARWGAGSAMVLVLNEALLGALLVLLQLVAHNQSAARGVYLSFHFANTLLLLAALALAAEFLSRPHTRATTTLRRGMLAFPALGILATSVGRSVRLFGSFGRYAVSRVLARCRTSAGFFFGISLAVASALGSSRPCVYCRSIYRLAAGAIVPSHGASRTRTLGIAVLCDADRAIFSWSFRCAAASAHMAADCPFTGCRRVLDLPGSADCQLLSSREIICMRKFSICRRSNG